jgi:SH3 domain-containing YSC84-like protein 1
MLFMNDHALQNLLSDKFKLGADTSLAAGPVGGTPLPAPILKLNAWILSFSRAKGVVAGVSPYGAMAQAEKSGDTGLGCIALAPIIH